jgi:plastocyanin
MSTKYLCLLLLLVYCLYFVQRSCGQCNVNGCTFSQINGPAQTQVTITFANYYYSPKCVYVTTNTTVIFNGDFSVHPLIGGTVSGSTKIPATVGPFTTMISSGLSANFTMSAGGVYPYYCNVHALLGMTGVVYVQPTGCPSVASHLDGVLAFLSSFAVSVIVLLVTLHS